MAIRIKFDPESAGYDYRSARAAGIKPKRNKAGKLKWQSRDPKTGLLLKGRKHKTWNLTEAAEKRAGYRIYKAKGRYYSTKIRGSR